MASAVAYALQMSAHHRDAGPRKQFQGEFA
jgi:hypothetical protein